MASRHRADVGAAISSAARTASVASSTEDMPGNRVVDALGELADTDDDGSARIDSQPCHYRSPA